MCTIGHVFVRTPCATNGAVAFECSTDVVVGRWFLTKHQVDVTVFWTTGDYPILITTMSTGIGIETFWIGLMATRALQPMAQSLIYGVVVHVPPVGMCTYCSGCLLVMLQPNEVCDPPRYQLGVHLHRLSVTHSVVGRTQTAGSFPCFLRNVLFAASWGVCWVAISGESESLDQVLRF